jgi:fatty acid desaturase
LLGYFLPIWIGYTGIMSYLYTEHMLCPMSETDDCLVTTLSVRVPRIFDYLHVNFSYHTEHHNFSDNKLRLLSACAAAFNRKIFREA